MLRKLVDLVGIYLSHRVLEHNGRDHARLVLAAFFLIRNRVIEEIIESLSADRVSKGGGADARTQHRLSIAAMVSNFARRVMYRNSILRVHLTLRTAAGPALWTCAAF